MTDVMGSAPAGANVIVAGVGGQGVLMISEMIALAAVDAGFDAKQTEVHGVSQRGGSVHSHVRFAARVHSPLVPIGQADLVIGLEKLEAYRFAPYIRPAGTVILNDYEVSPVSAGTAGVEAYPHDAAATLDRMGVPTRLVRATELAERDLGNVKVANLIVLGFAAPWLPIPVDTWAGLLATRIPPRFLDLNRRAFDLGASLAQAAGPGPAHRPGPAPALPIVTA